MKIKNTDALLKIIKKNGILRPRDLDKYGIPREYLRRLHEKGMIMRVGRGLYIDNDSEVTEYHSLAQAAKRIPNGVICLISALQFHGLTTQMPFEVWMAIEKNARQPKVDRPVIRIARFSGQSFSEGIELHTIENVQVKVYDPSKTVVDCFKYRNKIGIDVALDALRDCLNQKKCTPETIWNNAVICRVTKVIKPYLEALL